MAERSTSLLPKLEDPAWNHAASLAELGVLTASLLHELRQPLFAIKAHAQLGQVDKGTDRFTAILEQVQHVEALIQHYGSFGRNDEPETVLNLNDPIAGALRMMESRQRRSRVVLNAALLPDVLLIRGRDLAIRQIAVNLLQNAFDALEDVGGGEIWVATDQIGDVVRLVVADNGPGVPEDLRDRLFEPFVTTKPHDRGTGLGLFIARKLVHELLGTLRLVSPEVGGARFEMTFPRVVTAISPSDVGDLGFR